MCVCTCLIKVYMKYLPVLQIRMQLRMGEEEAQTGAAIACYLAQQGASLSIRNNAGKVPLDVVKDEKTVELVQQFAAA